MILSLDFIQMIEENKIIHIASDEKFIDSAYWQFEQVFPGRNLFYLLVHDCSKALKYVKINERIKLIKNNIKTLKDLPKVFDNAMIICFHGLDYHKSVVLNSTPSKYKILWMLWGTEFYNNPLIFNQKDIIGQQTYNTYLIKNPKDALMANFKDLFRQSIYRIKNNTNSPSKEVANAMKKADYCGILYKEEYDLIKTKVDSNLKYFKFSYYPIEKMVLKDNHMVRLDNILLGNSASYTNNHLEAFQILRKLSLGDRKIITPLSYGDENYKFSTIKAGKSVLKNNFKPLIDFMPVHKYNEYLLQCGIVIMNHYRQQAVGNVVTMLFMGAKVYLNEKNTLFKYLKSLNVYVYSISEDLIATNNKCFELLTNAQQLHNRNIVYKEIGQEILISELASQFEEINKF